MNSWLLTFTVYSVLGCALSVPSTMFKGYTEIPTPKENDRGMHPDVATKSHSINVQPKYSHEENSEYWMNQAKQFITDQVARKPNTNRAKNVILFLGDGMSISTQGLARLQLGGEEKSLSFENFPYVAMSKTYCTNAQVADSACSATAFLSGVKCRSGVIGHNGHVLRRNCELSMNPAHKVESIASWAMKANKQVGLVTTTRLTHATPAGLYANAGSRDWEKDSQVEIDGCDSELIDDIAEQLTFGEVGSKLKVVLGCGAREFLPNTTVDVDGVVGRRTDGKNLVEQWQAADPSRVFVTNREDLMSIDVNRDEQVLGVFNNDHCMYNLERKSRSLENVKPSIVDMTQKAIEILNRHNEGFFLLVEGGRIDHGHHSNYAHHSLEETLEFSRAIEMAMSMTNEAETLIVATADHSHVVTYAGYGDRGSDALGFGGDGDDQLPYLKMSYANGPGSVNHRLTEVKGRVDLNTMNRESLNFRASATVPLSSESHSGEDVAIYARGPFAHLFKSTMEQTVIPHIMAYASCIGNGLTACP